VELVEVVVDVAVDEADIVVDNTATAVSQFPTHPAPGPGAPSHVHEDYQIKRDEAT